MKTEMDYTYIAIYRFEGLAPSNPPQDIVVYENKDDRVTVTLTSNLSHHALPLDRSLAISSLLLRGLFSPENTPNITASVDQQIAEIQQQRVSKFGNSIFAVVTIKGRSKIDLKENLHKEADDFHLCFDAADKEALRKAHEEKIHSIISAISMATEPEYHAQQIATGFDFSDANGKPLYSLTARMGAARLTVPKYINPERKADISKMIGLAYGNKTLRTPFRLLSQSLATMHDNLRAFTAAWSSMEIFTNKVFSEYENRFISNISIHHDSHGVNQFLGRISEVMKDKYRLADKFSLISSFLSDDATADIEQFKKLKRIRDNISHGDEFDEEHLPVEDTRKLAAKYLGLHLTAEKSSETPEI